MLREFLSKIFSPPKPFEEPRVQKEDFARLKKRIREESEDEESCDLPHGRLSEIHNLHTPLKRSVSIGATSAAHERFLQRNAARADNWDAFDDVLHPVIEPEDLHTESFLNPQEEIELAGQRLAPLPGVSDIYLEPQPTDNSDSRSITVALVRQVELALLLNAQKALVKSSKSRIKVSTLKTFTKSKKFLKIDLAQRVLKNWLRKYATRSETPADALRALSESSFTEVRKGVAANERIPFECLWTLAHDREASVRLCIARNPNCSIELLAELSQDKNAKVTNFANQTLGTILGTEQYKHTYTRAE